MDKKRKILSLLGSAVIFGLSSEAVASSPGGEATCAGMKKAPQTKEEKEKKDKKKKPKEMTCAGQGTCGGMMEKKKEGSS